MSHILFGTILCLFLISMVSFKLLKAAFTFLVVFINEISELILKVHVLTAGESKFIKIHKRRDTIRKPSVIK